MSSLRVHQPRQGFSLLAMKQDEFRLRTAGGLVRARMIKILRIDQQLVIQRQRLGTNFETVPRLREPVRPFVKGYLRTAKFVVPSPGRTVTKSIEKPHQLGYRKILAEPGLSLQLQFSRIRSEITPQLKNPERLKAGDLIECYAMIYEARNTIPVAQIAECELGDGALHPQLFPLTQDKALMLGVPQLFGPCRHPFETQASTRHLYAGQRVYRLWPVFDPTIELATNSGKYSFAHRLFKYPLRLLKTLIAVVRGADHN